MATPAVPEKRLMGFGIKKGVAWGTAVALGAGFGALLESDGGLNRTQPYLPAMDSDSPMTLEGCLGPIDPVTFAPDFTMRYDPSGMGIAIASFFGTAGTPTDNTGSYTHKIQLADENYGNFVTFARENTAKIFEVASAKPTMLEFTIASGLMKGKMGFIGNTLINTSAINTLTQMDALTYQDRGNRVKFTQITVKINDQSGSDVGAETALEVSDLTVRYERPQDSVHKAGSAFVIEPAETGPPIVTVELKFPRENTINMAYFTTDFIGEVEKMIRISGTGALITGALYYGIRLDFPRLRVIDNPGSYEDILKNGLKLQAEEAATVPTGMTYKRPSIELDNLRTTDFLA